MIKIKSRSPVLRLSILVIFSLLLAACAAAPTNAPSPTSIPTEVALPNTGATAIAPTEAAPTMAPALEPTATQPAGASVEVADNPNLGQILVDGSGMTLYVFAKDGPDQVNCTGSCLVNWPPLITQGSPTAGNGVDASLLGTADLPDGSTVATYNHMPLYHWSKDQAPGDTNGQGFNGVWHVVSPAGQPVGVEPTIQVANDPALGPILVDGNGMTLYMYKKDEPDKSNCSGKCLDNWPPLVTASGSPNLGDGVNADLIGTASLPDGSRVATYNHMPLYLFIKDKAPGDTNGQGSFDVWYVVTPDGTPVDGSPAVQ